MPSTGNVYTYTLQAIANNLTPWQDILVANGSYLTSREINAVQLGLDFRFNVWQDVLVEPLLRWYRQTDAHDTTLTRTTPGLHLLWRVKDRFSIEAEADYEISHTNSPVIIDNVRRRFYYVGLALGPLNGRDEHDARSQMALCNRRTCRGRRPGDCGRALRHGLVAHRPVRRGWRAAGRR